MYRNIEVDSEEEDIMIREIAQKIHKYDLNVAAIFMIESFKPLSYIGMHMGRLFISSFLPIFGENVGIGGEKFFQIFEKHENVEKLIKAVEKLNQEEEVQNKAERAKKQERKGAETETGGVSNKKGWRRFIPFLNIYK